MPKRIIRLYYRCSNGECTNIDEVDLKGNSYVDGPRKCTYCRHQMILKKFMRIDGRVEECS